MQYHVIGPFGHLKRRQQCSIPYLTWVQPDANKWNCSKVFPSPSVFRLPGPRPLFFGESVKDIPIISVKKQSWLAWLTASGSLLGEIALWKATIELVSRSLERIRILKYGTLNVPDIRKRKRSFLTLLITYT